MPGVKKQDQIIDAKHIRNYVAEIVKGQVEKIVDMAKAQALESIGEDEASLRLMKRYL